MPASARTETCRPDDTFALSPAAFSVALHDFVARRAPLVPARLSVHSALESAPRTIPSRARRHHASALPLLTLPRSSIGVLW